MLADIGHFFATFFFLVFFFCAITKLHVYMCAIKTTWSDGLLAFVAAPDSYGALANGAPANGVPANGVPANSATPTVVLLAFEKQQRRRF